VRFFRLASSGVSVMEDEWTDKRMNDFAGRVGRFEGDVKEGFAKVEKRFDRVDERFDRFEADVDRRFDKLEAKVDSTNRTIWVGILVAVAVKILFG
jgi:hypothetical protein